MIDIAAIVNGTDLQSKIHLSQVLDSVGDLVPVVLPVIIGFIAFRKGYAFLKGALRSA